MKNVVIILIVLFFMSCSTKQSIVGGYWSSQNISPLGPVQIIYLQEDYTYIKVGSSSFGIYTEGKWNIKGDTLFLEDIYYVIDTKKKLIYEETDTIWSPWISKYIRQGKVWCYIDDIDKSKRKRDILEKSKSMKKEDVLNWPFRYK